MKMKGMGFKCSPPPGASSGSGRGWIERGNIWRKYFIIIIIYHFQPSTGNKVTDYGDLKLEMVDDDKPWNKVKNPRTVGLANKKVDAIRKPSGIAPVMR